jgi:hypothetical protein
MTTAFPSTWEGGCSERALNELFGPAILEVWLSTSPSCRCHGDGSQGGLRGPNTFIGPRLNHIGNLWEHMTHAIFFIFDGGPRWPPTGLWLLDPMAGRWPFEKFLQGKKVRKGGKSTTSWWPTVFIRKVSEVDLRPLHNPMWSCPVVESGEGGV